jgi:hypothetical protein
MNATAAANIARAGQAAQVPRLRVIKIRPPGRLTASRLAARLVPRLHELADPRRRPVRRRGHRVGASPGSTRVGLPYRRCPRSGARCRPKHRASDTAVTSRGGGIENSSRNDDGHPPDDARRPRSPVGRSVLAAAASPTANAFDSEGISVRVDQDDSPLCVRIERRDGGERERRRDGNWPQAAEPGGRGRITVQSSPGDREIQESRRRPSRLAGRAFLAGARVRRPARGVRRIAEGGRPFVEMTRQRRPGQLDRQRIGLVVRVIQIPKPVQEPARSGRGRLIRVAGVRGWWAGLIWRGWRAWVAWWRWLVIRRRPRILGLQAGIVWWWAGVAGWCIGVRRCAGVGWRFGVG